MSKRIARRQRPQLDLLPLDRSEVLDVLRWARGLAGGEAWKRLIRQELLTLETWAKTARPDDVEVNEAVFARKYHDHYRADRHRLHADPA